MMTNEKLHQIFVEYGGNVKLYTRKCLGLLMEINKRRIWEQKGFGSICEYARILAGLSDAQVKRALSLHERFEAMPALQNMLKNGEMGLSKLARVTSIATPENQQELAEKLKLLPKSAIETLVKDERMTQEQKNDEGNPKLAFGQTFVPGHKSRMDNKKEESATLHLNEEVTHKLLELQNKGINVDELLLELLNKRELELAQEKEELASEANQRVAVTNPSRYIKVKIRRLLRKEHGTKCSIQTCARDARVIHHTQRFALAKNHDPRYLAPLCKEHHQIAHSIDAKYHMARML